MGEFEVVSDHVVVVEERASTSPWRGLFPPVMKAFSILEIIQEGNKNLGNKRFARKRAAEDSTPPSTPPIGPKPAMDPRVKEKKKKMFKAKRSLSPAAPP